MSLAAAPALATPVPGATYRGTASTGGTIELDVSADGSAVTRFVAADVPGGCGGTIAKSFTGAIPIAGNAFSGDPADLIRVEGSFPSKGQAAGTLIDTACGAPVSWTAATDAATAPVPGTMGPVVQIRGTSPQPLRRDGSVRLRVGCPAGPCSVTAAGTVSVQRARPGRFRLVPASAQLSQGGSVRLEPKLGPRALKAARRALTAGRRARVRLTVTVLPGAGNRTVRSFSVSLRRRG